MADTRKAVLAAQLAAMPSRPFARGTGNAFVPVPNSPDPKMMKNYQDNLDIYRMPTGNPNLDVALPHSPDPKMSQQTQDMWDANSMLSAVQVQGLDAWNRIKSGKASPYDARTLAIMVGKGLDGGAPEGDWPKMLAAAKKYLPEK